MQDTDSSKANANHTGPSSPPPHGRGGTEGLFDAVTITIGLDATAKAVMQNQNGAPPLLDQPRLRSILPWAGIGVDGLLAHLLFGRHPRPPIMACVKVHHLPNLTPGPHEPPHQQVSANASEGAAAQRILPGSVTIVSKATLEPSSMLEATEAESQAVLHYLAGHVGVPGDQGDLIADLLERVAQPRDLWVSVVIDDSQHYFTVVRPERRRIHLRVLLSHVSAPKKVEPSVPAESTGTSLRLFRSFKDAVALRSTTEVATGPEQKPSNLPGELARRVGGVLFSAAHHAELSCFAGEARSRKLDAERLRHQLGKFELYIGRPATEWVLCPGTPSGLAKLLDQVLGARTGWSGVGRPYGLMAAVATAIDQGEKLITFAGKGHPWPRKVAGHVAQFGREASGPWLVLASIAETAFHRDTAAIIDAFAHPVLALDFWLLVDSNFEREVGQFLVERVATSRKHGLPVTLVKPLRNLTFLKNEKPVHIRPDFIAKFAGYPRPFYLEVLGSGDADYMNGKAGDADVLRQHGAYHAFAAASAKDNKAKWRAEFVALLDAYAVWLAKARAQTHNPQGGAR